MQRTPTAGPESAQELSDHDFPDDEDSPGEGDPNEAQAAWGESEAALFDAFVVPSYLALFTAQAERHLLIGEAARLVHLGCRSGHPDASWLERMPHTTGIGVDASPALLHIASSDLSSLGMRYLGQDPAQTGLDSASFSHAISFHPHGGVAERLRLFHEMARLLYPGGQALFALPVGESFQELRDLFAEYALKFRETNLERALEGLNQQRPTPDQLHAELLSVGLSDVGVEVTRHPLVFDSGLALVEDPVSRLMIFPHLSAWLGGAKLEDSLVEYLVRAIDKYWSDSQFELTLDIGVVSARR